jgi:hypothetical protein
MDDQRFHAFRRSLWACVVMLSALRKDIYGKVAEGYADQLDHSNEVRAFHLWGRGE